MVVIQASGFWGIETVASTRVFGEWFFIAACHYGFRTMVV